MSFPSVDKQMTVLQRGCEGIYSEDELRKKLEASRQANRPLRVKLGMDPTAPDIHLGHTVVLQKMRQFQDQGHRGVLIIGDFTARIGDPTGRTKTRPILDEQTIKANAETYFQQAGHVLDVSPDKLEIRYNSEWLSKMNLEDILRLTGNMTVAQILQRENFKERIKQEVEIAMTELMYPLMQAYDSVVIDADVELGGTDQTFNNLVGRDLMPKYGKTSQIVMITPILRGLDGVEKMSKSLGNYIGLTDSPKDMFGKTMRIADEMMKEWYTLLTDMPLDEIATLLGTSHPRDAKVRLAKQIVTRYYDREAADREEQLWQKVMVEGGLRDDVPAKQLDRSELDDNGRIGLPKLLKLLAMAPSTSEARRLISGGGVSVDREKVTDPTATVTPEEGMIVQVGKRRVAKLQMS
ncbi:MAG: tyrosine--tRNA ligase [Phycisphaerales bacterium]|nr:tyrosine--tRNA ligase [Phycisphaerales bacterium]